MDISLLKSDGTTRNWTRKGYSPLYARILAMLDQLETEHHNYWFDKSLSLSARFAKKAAITHKNKIQISGSDSQEWQGSPKMCCARRRKIPVQQMLCVQFGGRGTEKKGLCWKAILKSLTWLPCHI